MILNKVVFFVSEQMFVFKDLCANPAKFNVSQRAN